MSIRSILKFLGAALAVACIPLLPGTTLAASPAEARSVTYTLDIPAQDLNAALQQLALVSQHKLFYKSELVAGKTSHAIKGEFTADQAVQSLLSGTDLTYDITPSSVVLIRTKDGAAGKPNASVSSVGNLHLARADESSVSLPPGAGTEDPTLTNNASPAQDTAAASSAKQDPSTKIEEIVVTAQKRKESVQDVPISITVLTGEKLDSSTFQGITDALRTIPGIDTGVDQIGGGGGGAQISARGVSNAVRYTGPGPIAYYIDGTPYGFVRSPHYPANPNVYDLERIEFLAGPQGTLYGANALNGVLRILTRNADPDAFEFKSRGSVSSTGNGGENFHGDLALNVPIVAGKAAVRAIVGYQNDSGWVDGPIGNDLNDSESRNYRLKFHAKPTDAMAVDLSVWRSKTDREAPSLALANQRITSRHPQPGFDEFTSYGASIENAFAAFTLSSVTSYVDYSNAQIIDADGPIALPAQLESLFTSKVISEEINLTSNLEGRWRWSAGAFYRDAEDLTYSTLRRHPPSTLPIAINNDFVDTSESYAVYGEVGVDLTDTLELSLGARYFNDKQGTSLNQQYLLVAGVPIVVPPYNSKSDAVTPRAVLTWKLAPENTVYASYSQGFRSGFAQIPNVRSVFPNLEPVEPDQLSNYEIGSKGTLWNRRASYTSAIFYIDWKDIQQPLSVSVPATALFTNAVINGKSASGLGAELAVTTRPIDALELIANASWNDLSFDANVISTTNAGSILIGRKGSRLSSSPQYTVGGSAAYSFPLGANGLTGRLAVSGDYKDSIITRNAAGTVLFSDPTFVGAANFSIATANRWKGTFYVDNFTNEERSSTTADAQAEWRTRFRPRTFGLQLEYHY